jgi:uncharacterized protein (TIGR02265 family)
MELQNVLEADKLLPHLKGELAAIRRTIQNTPVTCKVNGMYVTAMRDMMLAEGVELPEMKAYPFRYYSLQDYMELVVSCSITLYGSVPLREGLRRLGRLVIPTFANSLVGKVLLANHFWGVALTCLARGYQVSLRPGKCTVTEFTSGHALIELRDVWLFGDSYQVGVIEGLMDWYKIDGTITPKSLSQCNTDLVVEWAIH